MAIELAFENVSKRFKRDWILENLSFHIKQGSKTAILGKNGSGKSTLLKIISGFTSTTAGEVQWTKDAAQLDVTKWHLNYTFSAPYLELIEEFTLQESIDFHFSLKGIRKDIVLDDILKEAGLSDHLSKQVCNFSSGMKQRLKLVLSLCSDVPIYLLDEPCSNLDHSGIEWYKTMIQSLPSCKTIIVASNNKDEYSFCEDTINVFRHAN
ncbi:MAG: ABC-type multidrug transport system ATPase subunit [Bacteroidia bacterium]|jgi:ABC-type multidrug transport system ATPase subunit